MRTQELGFFQVFGYFIIFALLGLLIWLNFSLAYDYGGLTLLAGVWAGILIVALILRLFSVRKRLSTAIETAWLALLFLCWILVLLDIALCSFSGQAICKPSSLSILGYGQELSIASYSLIIIATVMSALCFPWGLPLLVLWLNLMPILFAMGNLAPPDYFSAEGRLMLFFPAILMAPLGYWLWFCLLPELGSSTRRALRINEIKSGSINLARNTKNFAINLTKKTKIHAKKLKDKLQAKLKAIAAKRKAAGNNKSTPAARRPVGRR